MAKKGAVVKWKDVILCVIQYINEDEFKVLIYRSIRSYRRIIINQNNSNKYDTMVVF